MVKSARLILAIVLVGTLSTSLAVLPHAFNAFRLPKELALRAEAILLLAVYLGGLILGAQRPPRADRWLLLPASGLAWMALVTLTSTNRLVSGWHLLAGGATLVVYLATRAAGREESAFSLLVGVPLVAAVVNAIVDVVQELDLWMPFGVEPGIRHHFQCTALVGNPNEVGSYLAVAALGCLAGAVADRARRLWFALGTLLLVGGVIASQTLTALAAFLVAAFALFALVSWRHALRAASVSLVLLLLLLVVVAPLRTRASNMLYWLGAGEYNALLTERLTPFAAASLMVRDHPLLGVGPGAFGWNYYTYKLRAEERFPSLRLAWSRGANFGEVHDDHLQLLAEGGIAAYLLFTATVVLLSSISWRRAAVVSSTPQRFAARLAFPLAVIWVVLSLTQFPLETTAVRMLLVHFAALCVAWRAA